MSETDYAAFLAAKQIAAPSYTIRTTRALHEALFPFQRDIVAWALRKGRAAIFADCGLGKTLMQLEWGQHVHEATRDPVLILAPLAVSTQTVAEGRRFGYTVTPCRHQSDMRDGLNITNYEMLEHFDTARLAGIVLDESSILKAYDGKTRTAIIEAFGATPYRLACTATPAPNDFMELGNHADFLGVLTRAEMLATFFVHDGGDTSSWRLKGHAEDAFWRWLCTWAVTLRKPSDLGYSDDGFTLPPLRMHHHVLPVDPTRAVERGRLFLTEARTLDERRTERKLSIGDRVAAAAAVINATPGAWIVWCDFNAEADACAQSIPSSIEVSGSDEPDTKTQAVEWFVGSRCICTSPLFRAKLAAWQKTRSTSGSIISATAPSDWPNPNNTNKITPTPGATISRNIMPRTATSTNARPNNRIASTSDGESSTPPMPTTASPSKLPSKTRSCATLAPGSPIDCASLDSPSNNTNPCSTFKEDGAPSATPQMQETDAVTDSTLTTATGQESCGDFSAPPAILDLASLETTPTGSNAPPCICGHTTGRRILISKPSMFGFGLNLQHCHQSAFVGLSDSYERFYQAIRRNWRFGQQSPVDCHIFTSDTEGAVLANIERKEAAAAQMQDGMVQHMAALSVSELHTETHRSGVEYVTTMREGDGWTMHQGDCIEGIRALPADSVHYSIFSPPFASLYTYSASERDMGNARNHAEFFAHFRFLVGDLLRVTMPGRLLSFHCMNLPTSKMRDNVIGLTDFRGALIKEFTDAGWIFHSEVCIWKDPVTSMQRTKALGLLHKQIVKDSCMSRQGIPDYLVTMRKPGENPERVTGPLTYYRGDDSHLTRTYGEDTGGDTRASINIWQRYASPVWMDIDPSRTLQRTSAREEKDERHICPLQLDVIERALQLWTNPGDLVLSPFGGIGSEGYCAVQMGRRFLGFELKRSYWEQACANLAAAARQGHAQRGLFDAPDAEDIADAV